MPTGDVLIPGSGFAGDLTATNPGTDTRAAICRWTQPPFQTVTGTLRVGVAAEHHSGIDRVEFYMDGGPAVVASTRVMNPDTGIYEFWATVDVAQFAVDAITEIRAVVYPVDGVVRILQGNPFDADANEDRSFWLAIDKGGLRRDVRYVDTVNGSNTSDGLTAATAWRDLNHAIRTLNDGAGTEAYGATIRLMSGTYVPFAESAGGATTEPRMRSGNAITYPGAFAGVNSKIYRYLTIEPEDGQTVVFDVPAGRTTRRISPDSTTWSGPTGAGPALVRIRNINCHFSGTTTLFLGFSGRADMIWLDNCDIKGPLEAFTNGGTIGPEGSATALDNAWSRAYITGGSVRQWLNGPRAWIVRDAQFSRFIADTLTGVQIVANVVVEEMDRFNTSAHGDVHQIRNGENNRLAINVTAKTGIEAQCILYTATVTPATGWAFVGGEYDNTRLANGGEVNSPHCFSPSGIDHLVVRNSQFRGRMQGVTDVRPGWRIEGSVFQRHTLAESDATTIQATPGLPPTDGAFAAEAETAAWQADGGSIASLWTTQPERLPWTSPVTGITYLSPTAGEVDATPPTATLALTYDAGSQTLTAVVTASEPLGVLDGSWTAPESVIPSLFLPDFSYDGAAITYTAAIASPVDGEWTFTVTALEDIMGNVGNPNTLQASVSVITSTSGSQRRRGTLTKLLALKVIQ